MENNNGFKKFIIFWLSQSVSQLGSSMTSFALVIWIFKETGSTMAVSLLTFFSYLPYVLVSIFSGTFVDKHDKKKIMLCTDLVAAVCSISVIIFMALGKLHFSYIYIINIITGTMHAFQSPASSVTVGMLVPKDKYSQVSGMNSFSTSLITIVTPMIASFVTSFWGLETVIFIDLATFIFAFVVLIFIKVPKYKVDKERIFILDGVKDGLKFLQENKHLLYLIFNMALLIFFSRLTYENILPAMILSKSGGNDVALGFVSGVLGVGGIVGGLLVSFIKLPKDNVKLIFFSAGFSFLFGDMLMGIGNNIIVWSIAGLAASIPIPFINAGQNNIMYNSIPTNMQGRVFAVRNAIQYFTIPLGTLLGGYLAEFIFEPFMIGSSDLALFLNNFVGSGEGSGMSLMFLCTGILGFLSSVIGYKNKVINKIEVENN